MRASRFLPTDTLLPVLLLALVSSGCASAAARGPAGSPEPASAREMEALYRARLDSARVRFTEADVRFMTGMIAHHAQALVIAGLAADRDASPAVQTLAARIINAQRDEIASMQQWLRDRGQPVPEVRIEGLSLHIHPADHAGHQPGMLSDAQLAELARARGPEFDRLFLTYMIQHHRGAVEMVQQLFSTDGAGQDEAVFKFASDVQVDQTTEIARMELMLSALPAAGRSP